MFFVYDIQNNLKCVYHSLEITNPLHSCTRVPWRLAKYKTELSGTTGRGEELYQESPKTLGEKKKKNKK